MDIAKYLESRGWESMDRGGISHMGKDGEPRYWGYNLYRKQVGRHIFSIYFIKEGEYEMRKRYTNYWNTIFRGALPTEEKADITMESLGIT